MDRSRLVLRAAARVARGAALLTLGCALRLAAQATTTIGTTSVGNPVLLESKSVKTGADGIITATVRARFLKPIKVGATEYRASRTIAMFNCTTAKVAVKENWYYSDEKGTKVAQHKVVGIPGYGVTIKGSLPDVAMKHLCSKQ